MKIAIITVNYLSVNALHGFYQSVKVALDFDGLSSVELLAIDNSGELKKEHLPNQHERLALNIIKSNTNLGYFGAKRLLKDRYSCTDLDYILYCNCDLKLDINFLKELRMLEFSSDVLAPSILSMEGELNSNPKYLYRLSKRKLQRIKFVKKYYVIDWMYTYLSDLSLKNRQKNGSVTNDNSSIQIYAPHGSLLIFKNLEFFNNLNDYSSFMFCEELYVAEEARLKNLKINFYPNLVVYDDRHESISKMPTKTVAQWYGESLDFILNKYYF